MAQGSAPPVPVVVLVPPVPEPPVPEPPLPELDALVLALVELEVPELALEVLELVVLALPPPPPLPLLVELTLLPEAHPPREPRAKRETSMGPPKRSVSRMPE
jgi:hypothetical protein